MFRPHSPVSFCQRHRKTVTADDCSPLSIEAALRPDAVSRCTGSEDLPPLYPSQSGQQRLSRYQLTSEPYSCAKSFLSDYHRFFSDGLDNTLPMHASPGARCVSRVDAPPVPCRSDDDGGNDATVCQACGGEPAAPASEGHSVLPSVLSSRFSHRYSLYPKNWLRGVALF